MEKGIDEWIAGYNSGMALVRECATRGDFEPKVPALSGEQDTPQRREGYLHAIRSHVPLYKDLCAGPRDPGRMKREVEAEAAELAAKRAEEYAQTAADQARLLAEYAKERRAECA